jgi:hypothetical protein
MGLLHNESIKPKFTKLVQKNPEKPENKNLFLLVQYKQ